MENLRTCILPEVRPFRCLDDDIRMMTLTVILTFQKLATTLPDETRSLRFPRAIHGSASAAANWLFDS